MERSEIWCWFIPPSAIKARKKNLCGRVYVLLFFVVVYKYIFIKRIRKMRACACVRVFRENEPELHGSRVVSDVIKSCSEQSQGGKEPVGSWRPMDSVHRNRYPPGTSTLLRIQQMEQVNGANGKEKQQQKHTRGGERASKRRERERERQKRREGREETDGVCSIMKARP